MRTLLLLLTILGPGLFGQVPRLLYSGVGHPAPAPPYRFVKEEKSGTTPKLWVRDARGRTWIVKWGKEVRGDIFASRLARSVGYYASPVYLVRQGTILGARGASGTRADEHVDKHGRFRNGRFKLVDFNFHYAKGGWRWDRNPFMRTADGRRELNGLKLLMLLVSNWDGKDAREGSDANTAVFVRGREAYYAVDDWGASMGGWGNFFTRDKWDCDEFREQNDNFIEGISRNGAIEWGFSGTHAGDLTDAISPEDVRWFLNRISRAKITSALAATGAPPIERRCMQRALEGRLRSLQAVAYGVRTARR